MNKEIEHYEAMDSLEKSLKYLGSDDFLNDTIEKYFNKQVYCTDCEYFRLDDEYLPYCPFDDKCDICDCEDSKDINRRLHYLEKEEN